MRASARPAARPGQNEDGRAQLGPVLGIDLGSRSVKLALADSGNQSSHPKDWTRISYPTFEFYRRFLRRQEGLALDLTALELPRVAQIVSTGYGRNNVGVAGSRQVTELTAHAKGAVALTGLSDFVLVDIGGQDVKVVFVEGGRMTDFAANDRCAASSGRYLENMASLLGVSLEELGTCWEGPAEISSTCAVFGETEVIAKVSEGAPLQSLMAGINFAVFRKIEPLVRSFLDRAPRLPLICSGGVARSRALQQILYRELGVEVVVPEQPEFTGAVGCALLALVAKDA